MIEIIILGLVLFIVGVGSSILYDKHKDLINTFIDTVKVKIQTSKNIPKPTPVKRRKKSSQEIDEEFIEKFKEHVSKAKKSVKKAKTKKVVKRSVPKTNRFDVYNSTYIPEPINHETFTVQELKDIIAGRVSTSKDNYDFAKKAVTEIDGALEETDATLSDIEKMLSED